MPDPVFFVGIEFVTGSFTAVTEDCLKLSVSRRTASLDNGLSMGRAGFLLDNYQNKYAPNNSSGVFFPYLKTNKAIKVQATYSGSTYNLFSGFIDSYSIDPHDEKKTTFIQASDTIKQLLLQEISQPIETDYNVGSLFTDILSRSNISSANRTIDTLNDEIPFVHFQERRPTDAMNDLIKMGYYKAYVGTDGKVNIKDRYWQQRASVVSSHDKFYGMSYRLDETRLANNIRVTCQHVERSTSVQTISWVGEAHTIVASSYLSFWLDYRDPDTLESGTPANSMVSLVSSTDYYASTTLDGTGEDRTSTTSVDVTFFATSAICSLFNGSADTIYLNRFQLRGYSIQKEPKMTVEAISSSSQAVYGKRNYSLQSDLISELVVAQDYASFLKTEKEEPIDQVSVELKNEWADQLGLDLGDLIHINNSNTAIGSAFWISNIDHEVNLTRGLEFITSYDVEFFRYKGWFVLDHATRGKLDTGKLGF